MPASKWENYIGRTKNKKMPLKTAVLWALKGGRSKFRAPLAGRRKYIGLKTFKNPGSRQEFCFRVQNVFNKNTIQAAKLIKLYEYG